MNEHLIQGAITELSKGKTVIIIAHRLATIESVDQILVVDNGIFTAILLVVEFACGILR